MSKDDEVSGALSLNLQVCKLLHGKVVNSEADKALLEAFKTHVKANEDFRNLDKRENQKLWLDMRQMVGEDKLPENAFEPLDFF